MRKASSVFAGVVLVAGIAITLAPSSTALLPCSTTGTALSHGVPEMAGLSAGDSAYYTLSKPQGVKEYVVVLESSGNTDLYAWNQACQIVCHGGLWNNLGRHYNVCAFSLEHYIYIGVYAFDSTSFTLLTI